MRSSTKLAKGNQQKKIFFGGFRVLLLLNFVIKHADFTVHYKKIQKLKTKAISLNLFIANAKKRITPLVQIT